MPLEALWGRIRPKNRQPGRQKTTYNGIPVILPVGAGGERLGENFLRADKQAKMDSLISRKGAAKAKKKMKNGKPNCTIMWFGDKKCRALGGDKACSSDKIWRAAMFCQDRKGKAGVKKKWRGKKRGPSSAKKYTSHLGPWKIKKGLTGSKFWAEMAKRGICKGDPDKGQRGFRKGQQTSKNNPTCR